MNAAAWVLCTVMLEFCCLVVVADDAIREAIEMPRWDEIGPEVTAIGITWWCDEHLAVAELTEIVGLP